MGIVDILGHLLNLFFPALALGAIAAALAKGVWRRELSPLPWWRLAAAAAASAALTTLAGLALWGADGRMATYAAMVVAAAATLWWLGFGPGR